MAVPGAAAQNAIPAILDCAGRTVSWRTVIRPAVTVFDPLPDIAVHVVKAKIVRLILTNFSGIVSDAIAAACVSFRAKRL